MALPSQNDYVHSPARLVLLTLMLGMLGWWAIQEHSALRQVEERHQALQVLVQTQTVRLDTLTQHQGRMHTALEAVQVSTQACREQVARLQALLAQP